MRKFYTSLNEDHNRVPWFRLICHDRAILRAVTCLWLQDTKMRLQNLVCYKIVNAVYVRRRMKPLTICSLAAGEQKIWGKVLDWMDVQHDPQDWTLELNWIIRITKGKGWRSSLMKMAITEAGYCIWKYRNTICFGTDVDNISINRQIVDNMLYRGWQIPKLRGQIASMML